MNDKDYQQLIKQYGNVTVPRLVLGFLVDCLATQGVEADEGDEEDDWCTSLDFYTSRFMLRDVCLQSVETLRELNRQLPKTTELEAKIRRLTASIDKDKASLAEAQALLAGVRETMPKPPTCINTKAKATKRG